MPLSKTILFERRGREKRFRPKIRENVSQNSLLISFSQKLILQSGYER